MVSVCLPSDALSQHLPSYWGFSYLGCGISLHGCSSKVQLLLLTLDVGYFLRAAAPDLGCGVSPFGCSRAVHPLLATPVTNSCEKKRSEKQRRKGKNAEFQRIAKRDKKAFLSDQCKEIEENNRMGKTRYLFKKIVDSKGIFHAKMGSIKDRNGMDLTVAEDIKKKWQEYTEELYKKVFMTQIIMMV